MDFNTEDFVKKLQKNKLLIPALVIGGGIGLFVMLKTSKNSVSNPLEDISSIPESNNTNPDTSGDMQSQFDNLQSQITGTLDTVQNNQDTFMQDVTDYINGIELGFNNSSDTTAIGTSQDYSQLDDIYRSISDVYSYVDANNLAGNTIDANTMSYDTPIYPNQITPYVNQPLQNLKDRATVKSGKTTIKAINPKSNLPTNVLGRQNTKVNNTITKSKVVKPSLPKPKSIKPITPKRKTVLPIKKPTVSKSKVLKK